MSSNLAPTPKVAAAVIGGIIASALLANINLITPDLFDGLGKWSGLAFGLTITLVMGAAGWLKSEAAGASADPVPADVPAAPAPVDFTPVSAAPSVFPAAAVKAALPPVSPEEVPPLPTV